MEVASVMASKEDRGEESSLSATLSCTLSGDLPLAWYWRGRWEMAFSCCLLLSRAVDVCSSVIDVPTSDLSLGWYWLGRWAGVFPCGMLLGRAVGVCKPVTIRGFVTSDLSLAWHWPGRGVMVFPCWMLLGRAVGVCKPVTTRGVVTSELIFLTCIGAEPCVVDGKELRKFLLTAMDVCICCIALMDDSSRAFTAFFWFCAGTDFTSAAPKFWFRSKRGVVFCRFVVCFVVAPSLKRFRLVTGSSSPQFSNSQFLAWCRRTSLGELFGFCSRCSWIILLRESAYFSSAAFFSKWVKTLNVKT